MSILCDYLREFFLGSESKTHSFVHKLAVRQDLLMSVNNVNVIHTHATSFDVDINDNDEQKLDGGVLTALVRNLSTLSKLFAVTLN